jgi:hypothetical protein
MKQFFTIISLVFISLVAKAQNKEQSENPSVAKDLKASVAGNHLRLTWESGAVGNDKYWEVQGSRDGKNFSTIGLVFGSNPKTRETGFIFKQNSNKIIPGIKYYRVLLVENETSATASAMISLSK